MQGRRISSGDAYCPIVSKFLESNALPMNAYPDQATSSAAVSVANAAAATIEGIMIAEAKKEYST
jgi:hypothetical protein